MDRIIEMAKSSSIKFKQNCRQRPYFQTQENKKKLKEIMNSLKLDKKDRKRDDIIKDAKKNILDKTTN